jgi:pimeloyl-ACP methyl ester carboxylesterase
MFTEFCQQQHAGSVAGLLQFAALTALGETDERKLVRRLRTLVQHQALPNAASLAVGLHYLAEIDHRERLAALDLPCLHIYPQQDQLVPVEVAGRVDQSLVIPGSHAVLLAGQPQPVAAIQDFYRRLGVNL